MSGHRLPTEVDVAVVGSGAAGFVFSPEVNDSFNAVNKLLAEGDSVFRFSSPATVGGTEFPHGAFYVSAGSGTAGRLESIADEIGDCVVTEFAQVGRDHQREQDVSAGPTHQINAAGEAHRGDQTWARDDSSRTVSS